MLTNEQANKFIAEIERFMTRALTPISVNPLDNPLSLRAIVLGHLDASQAPDVFISADGIANYRELCSGYSMYFGYDDSLDIFCCFNSVKNGFGLVVISTQETLSCSQSPVYLAA